MISDSGPSQLQVPAMPVQRPARTRIARTCEMSSLPFCLLIMTFDLMPKKLYYGMWFQVVFTPKHQHLRSASLQNGCTAGRDRGTRLQLRHQGIRAGPAHCLPLQLQIFIVVGKAGGRSGLKQDSGFCRVGDGFDLRDDQLHQTKCNGMHGTADDEQRNVGVSKL